MKNNYIDIKSINLLIKRYRYIVTLIIIIGIVSWVCLYNYNMIEEFTTSCRSSTSFPSVNYTQFKAMTTSGQSPVTYYNYNCNNREDSSNCIIGYYTPYLGTDKNNDFIKFNSRILAEGGTMQERIDYCAKKANNDSSIDFFAIDDDCNCNMYRLDPTNIATLDKDINSLIIKSIPMPTECNSLENIVNLNKNIQQGDNSSSTDNQNYVGIGFGAFTSRGYNVIDKSGYGDILRYYNPLCDSQTALNNYTSLINNCINNISNGNKTAAECQSYIDNYKTIASDINTTLGGVDFYATDDVYSCNGSQCISGSFQDGNYLGNIYTSLESNTITEASYNQYTQNLTNYNNSLAIEEDSRLESNSMNMVYLLVAVVLIITLIMFFLNITNPDIITAEILIGYIIFMVFIVFVTSKYFNVDYGSLNKFFTIQLGESGNIGS